MSEHKDQLKGLIQDGQTDLATEMVRSAGNYVESEAFVRVVLREEKSTPELVDATLTTFLNAKPDYARSRYCGGGHGGWVHSLSHFTRILWEHRMDDWIKKFNEVSFRGADELDDYSCSDRLVVDFGSCAKYNDDPVNFALTPENLHWMDWEYAAYTKARIEAGCFESEEDFLRWKLHQPETHTTFDYDAQIDLVDIDGIRSIVQQLQELGADISEFDGLERDLLTKQLSELNKELSAETRDWKRERLEKGIQKTRAALA